MFLPTSSTFTTSKMESLPQDLQALFSKVLPKIFIAIDGLSSLRDVPTILEHVMLRLTFLEYAMSVWRQAQSPNSHAEPSNLSRSSPSHRSRHSDLSGRWRLLFSDKYLFFLFKNILLDCSKRSDDSNKAHTYAEAVHLRHASVPGIYELSAAPARAVLRKILESSLRTLIENLVLSNTAKYGTWQNVRVPDTSPKTPPGFQGTESQGTSRTNIGPQTSSRPGAAQFLRLSLFEAMQTFKVLDIVQAADTFDVHRIMSYTTRSWLDRPSLNGNSAHLYPAHVKEAKDLFMRRGLPLDFFVYTSSHMAFSVQKSRSDNASSPSHSCSDSGRHVSKSATFFITDLEVAADILRLGLSKVQASQTTRQKLARLLVRLFAKRSGIAISLHESEEGHYVRLQSIEPRQIETTASRLQLATTGALTNLIEIANSTGSRHGSGAYDFIFKTLLQVCVSVSGMNEYIS